MKEERLLGIQEYISELMQNGKIEDRPYIKGHPELDPIYLVERTERFFIARQLLSNYIDENEPEAIIRRTFRLAYFPTNVNHAEIFSMSYVKRGGPQHMLPGSVAVLDAVETFDSLTSYYLQYCFIQGSPPELTRSLASKYMGAGYYLLRSFFQMASPSKIKTISLKNLARREGNRKLLEKILSEHDEIISQFSEEEFVLFRKSVETTML